MGLFGRKTIYEMNDKELDKEVRRKKLRFGESIADKARIVMEANRRDMDWKDSDLRKK